MELSLELPFAGFTVRRVEDAAVVIGNERLERSFLLAPDRVVHNFAAQDATALNDAALATILELEPELVLVGTGARQVFIDAALQAACLSRNIGIECMDNHACARTYNLLVGESRRVVAVFLLPNGG